MKRRSHRSRTNSECNKTINFGAFTQPKTNQNNSTKIIMGRIEVHKLKKIFSFIFNFMRNILVFMNFMLIITGIYEIYYNTEPTINAASINPSNPFNFPFSVTNNSHFVPMNNVHWTCKVNSLDNIYGGGLHNLSVDNPAHIIPKLNTGETQNVSCRRNITVNLNQNEIVNLEAEIQLSYELKLLIFNIHRRYFETFTWTKASGNPQWLKGKNFE